MLSLYLPYMNQNRTFKALSRAMSVKGMTLIMQVAPHARTRPRPGADQVPSARPAAWSG